LQFMGFDGFIWFTGVVEDRLDPMKLGRVRVRIAGLHTEVRELGLTEGIPVEELPWAHPMQPLTSAAMNGIGTTPLGPVEGTWVVGFFRDGENAQEPVVIGTLGGVPYEPPKPIGFHDPKLFYPKGDHLIEPDTYRRARPTFIEPRNGGEIESKPTPLDERERDLGVSIALDGTWSEPPDPFDAEYPYNHTRVSEFGHVEEWDDTPENARLMRWHKSGTFEEIREDGTKVTKIQKDNYKITLGDDFVHVKKAVSGGNMYVTVDGDCHLRVDGDYKMEVLKDWIANVGGDMIFNVFRNTRISTVGTKLDKSGGVHTIKGSIIHLNPTPPGQCSPEWKINVASIIDLVIGAIEGDVNSLTTIINLITSEIDAAIDVSTIINLVSSVVGAEADVASIINGVTSVLEGNENSLASIINLVGGDVDVGTIINLVSGAESGDEKSLASITNLVSDALEGVR